MITLIFGSDKFGGLLKKFLNGIVESLTTIRGGFRIRDALHFSSGFGNRCDAVKNVGFDLVTTANNHGTDELINANFFLSSFLVDEGSPI